MDAKQTSVVMAPQDRVIELKEYVDRILEALPNVKGALVTDLSCISDFAIGDVQEYLDKVGDKLGVEIKRGQSGLVTVAERLRQNDSCR